ncbi:MAG: hypothetical protein ACJ75B_17255, partial [Flavisolibacter sp.]
ILVIHSSNVLGSGGVWKLGVRANLPAGRQGRKEMEDAIPHARDASITTRMLYYLQFVLLVAGDCFAALAMTFTGFEVYFNFLSGY